MKQSAQHRLPAGRQGFTLMELLVVISIIGILISVSVVSYVTAQQKARDTRRIQDIKAIQGAWEEYYADNSSNYPTTCDFSLAPVDGKMSGTYLPGGLPVDPKGGVAYPTVSGWSSCAISTYCFCAGLENVGYKNSDTDCNGAPFASSYKGLYCVRNLQ